MTRAPGLPLAASIAIVAVLFGGVAPTNAAPSVGSTTVSVSGTVESSDPSTPIPSGTVRFYPVGNPATYQQLGISDGVFSGTVTPAGDYRLQYDFFNTMTSNALTPYWSGAASLATAPIVHIPDVPFTLPTATVPAGAVISGTGTQEAPIQTPVSVTATSSSGAVWQGARDSVGNFRIAGLPSGSFTVRMSGQRHYPVFWPGTEDPSTAVPIVLAAGEVHDHVDATIPRWPSISGHVTYVTGSQAHGSVTLADASGKTLANGAAFGASGDYIILAPPGTYTLIFTPGDLQSARQWFGDTAFAEQSTPVTIARGSDAANIDATFHDGAILSVRDRSPAAEPIVEHLYQRDGDEWRRLPDLAGVTPTFWNLRPGDYTIGYQDTSVDPQFFTTYTGGGTSLAEATAIPVAAGSYVISPAVTLKRIPFVPFAHDYDIDGLPDLLVRDSHLGLWMAAGTSDAGFAALTPRNGSGQGRVFVGGDLSGGGNVDVLAIASDGTLRRELRPGGVNTDAVKVATGWSGESSVFGPGDLTGDGKADLVSRRSNGDLRLWPGTGAGTLAPSWLLSKGWQKATAILAGGDLNGDGKQDIVARDSAGALWLYPGDGAGHLSARTKISAGWQKARQIFSIGDVNHDGHDDLLAKDAAGVLWLYPGDGHGHLGARARVSSGWGPYTFIA